VSRAGPAAAPGTAARGERFTVAMAAIVRRLPFGLAGIIPPILLAPALLAFAANAARLRRWAAGASRWRALALRRPGSSGSAAPDR
jgi:hypothetical protein